MVCGMGFKKATRTQSKLRCAIFGPSGAGKTFTALRIATGMVGGVGKIGLIDTEHGSASKYADRFQFETDYLDDATIDNILIKFADAQREKFDVLIIDSLSHAWQELVQGVDRLAKAKYKGNTWSAWSEGTPKQKSLIKAILTYPGHVLATMRSKTEWQTDTDGGKSKPVRVGLAPEQGKGIEYEFDLLIEMNTDHIAHVIKDRTGKFQDAIIDKPSEEFGNELVAWLNGGPPQPEKKNLATPLTAEEKAAIAVDAMKGAPERNPGDAYRIPDGKYKGKLVKDISPMELRNYIEWITDKAKFIPDWWAEFLNQVDAHQAQLAEKRPV